MPLRNIVTCWPWRFRCAILFRVEMPNAKCVASYWKRWPDLPKSVRHQVRVTSISKPLSSLQNRRIEMEQSDTARAAENDLIDLWSNILPESLWKNRTGRGVKVAIVDSGIDTEHPALKGKIKASVQAIPENGQIAFKPSTSGDQAGHGTACAGIITSIAPEVEIYSIKVLGPTG